MTNKPCLVIGDADATIGSVNPAGANHPRVLSISQRLQSIGAQVIFPATAVSEAITLVHRRLGNVELTKGLVERVQGEQLSVLAVNEETIRSASNYFDAKGSKDNTYFDEIVAAVAKSNFADAIFSFDAWYKKLGFRLAEELV